MPHATRSCWSTNEGDLNVALPILPKQGYENGFFVKSIAIFRCAWYLYDLLAKSLR